MSNALIGFAAGLSVCAGIYGMVVRFSNPQFTETQIFLHDWKLYVAVIIVAYLCVIVASHHRDEK